MYSLPSNNATILVTDDSEINRELLSDILIGEGYKVVCAEDGSRALHEIENRVIDLVLLDVMMPGMTGFDVCQSIKSRPETRFIPVVLVTGLTSVEERILGIRSGAVQRTQFAAQSPTSALLRFLSEH